MYFIESESFLIFYWFIWIRFSIILSYWVLDVFSASYKFRILVASFFVQAKMLWMLKFYIFIVLNFTWYLRTIDWSFLCCFFFDRDQKFRWETFPFIEHFILIVLVREKSSSFGVLVYVDVETERLDFLYFLFNFELFFK